MYPVPIILENMNTIAEDEDLTQAVGLQLTRRFFLVDSKSGREVGPGLFEAMPSLPAAMGCTAPWEDVACLTF